MTVGAFQVNWFWLKLVILSCFGASSFFTRIIGEKGTLLTVELCLIYLAYPSLFKGAASL